jgi:hypothetical protein
VSLKVVGSQQALVDAINSFDPSYHADYFSVRALARDYLSSCKPNYLEVNALATVLHVVLKRYGAERQKAPTRKSIEDIESTLLDSEVHGLLRFFSTHSISTINIIAGSRISQADIQASDENTVKILRLLGNRLFTNNTNVTYPMKALMLMTGYMPALDSQVKSGLDHAGITGVNTTQFLLPKTTTDLEGKKITRLPYLLAACYSNPECRAVIDAAAQESKYKCLATEVGRIFDVLLFMQAAGQRRLLAFTPNNAAKWYAVV